MRHAKLWAAVLVSAALVGASWRGWFPAPLTETLGFVTGAWCVYLVAVQHIANFPLGIANNLFFLVLFYEARIYGVALTADEIQTLYLLGPDALQTPEPASIALWSFWACALGFFVVRAKQRKR